MGAGVFDASPHPRGIILAGRRNRLPDKYKSKLTKMSKGDYGRSGGVSHVQASLSVALFVQNRWCKLGLPSPRR